jgi:hypothetical protein
MIRLKTMIASAFLIGLAGRAAAQANPDSVQHVNDCRLAAQTLSRGNPAPTMQWSLSVIRSCGDHGVVGTSFAAALTRLRTSSDTGQLLPLARATLGLVDGNVYAAAFAVAGDGSASATARAVSLVLVLTQVQPDAVVFFTQLASTPDAEFCPWGIRSGVRVIAGPAPLPGDAKTKALALAQSFQNDASAAALVRGAARCVSQAFFK